jgi:hypothetical protein
METYLSSYPDGIAADVYFAYLGEVIVRSLSLLALTSDVDYSSVYQEIRDNTFQDLLIELQSPDSTMTLAPEVLAEIPVPQQISLDDFLHLSPDEQMALLGQLPEYQAENLLLRIRDLNESELTSYFLTLSPEE